MSTRPALHTAQPRVPTSWLRDMHSHTCAPRFLLFAKESWKCQEALVQEHTACSMGFCFSDPQFSLGILTQTRASWYKQGQRLGGIHAQLQCKATSHA